MNDFEAIARFADGLQAKWNETTHKGNNKNSFAGIQRLLKSMHLFLKNTQAEMDEEYQKILGNGKYTSAYINKKRVEFDKKYQETKKTVISGIEKDIQAMIADKYLRLDRMITEAPTPQQTALLQTLQMRGKNISKGELMKVMPYFFRNYQSMRVFETLALAAGYHIPIPLDGDIVDMYSKLDEGGRYLLECAANVGKKTINLHGAFFYEDSKNPGNADIEYQQYIDLFDVPAQLQDYAISEKLSEAEEAKVKTYFAEFDKLDPEKDSVSILRMAQKVIREHPGDVELMKKSAYGKLVTEVQELEAINAKKADNEQKKAATNK